MKNKYSDHQLTLMFPKGTQVKVEIHGKEPKFGKITTNEIKFERVGVEYEDDTWGYPHTDFVTLK